MKALNKQYRIENIHISTVKVGDTILHTDGQLRTVCRNNIKVDQFMGLSLFGDTYMLGLQPVKKVIFIHKKNRR